MKRYSFIPLAIALAACTAAQSTEAPQANDSMTAKAEMSQQQDMAIFAGGCFWCVESDFEKLDGVIEAVSGYSGADQKNPTYRNHGKHREVAKIVFDPQKISYRELVDYYWRHVDPTDDGGQFCDRGHAYTTAVYARPDQIETAKASKAEIEKTKPFDAPIVTPVLAAKTFWDAEDYHQDYYKKNPLKYKFYRNGCGRDKRVKKLWGK